VQADSSYFRFYRSGVVDSDECGTNLNHAILTVGYSDKGSAVPYWIVKNSWGAGWGDNGYIKLAIREGKGVCGVHMDTTYPIVKK